MLHDGALEEARSLGRLGRLGLSPDLPAMKAIGVRQFLDHDLGKLTLAEAVAAVKTETRRYAKRQFTWFRHQMQDWPRLDPAA
jgi:tRNA dimethylallyltransferase